MKSKDAKSTQSKTDEKERLLVEQLEEQQKLYEKIVYEESKLK